MFKVKKEALLHGDLHAGSIMVNEESLRVSLHPPFLMACLSPWAQQVIDPEFATVGPFGFDMGCLLASLCMAYFRSVIQIARAKHGTMPLAGTMFMMVRLLKSIGARIG